MVEGKVSQSFNRRRYQSLCSYVVDTATTVHGKFLGPACRFGPVAIMSDHSLKLCTILQARVVDRGDVERSRIGKVNRNSTSSEMTL